MKNVPLPRRMQILQKDPRGYPIPFIVLRDSDGRPHFTINDDQKVEWALRRHLCGICGQKLYPKRQWLVGGPLSAFHDHGAYIDGPLHRECAEYALQVCPFLAAPNYSRRIDGKTLDPKKTDPRLILMDTTMIPERPPLYVLAATTEVTAKYNGVVRYLFPKRPWKEVHFWRNGVQLTAGEGQQLSAQALKEAG